MLCGEQCKKNLVPSICEDVLPTLPTLPKCPKLWEIIVNHKMAFATKAETQFGVGNHFWEINTILWKIWKIKPSFSTLLHFPMKNRFWWYKITGLWHVCFTRLVWLYFGLLWFVQVNINNYLYTRSLHAQRKHFTTELLI